jgi:hypothetical protein
MGAHSGKRRSGGIDGMTHISDILAEIDWLEALRREALQGAARHGPLRGPVLHTQKPWSRTLDVLEGEREKIA